jgi:hypothetical protein
MTTFSGDFLKPQLALFENKHAVPNTPLVNHHFPVQLLLGGYARFV